MRAVARVGAGTQNNGGKTVAEVGRGETASSVPGVVVVVVVAAAAAAAASQRGPGLCRFLTASAQSRSQLAHCASSEPSAELSTRN